MIATTPLFLAIGECMLEFARQADDSWRLGYAGDTLNTAWYFRAAAGRGAWRTAYCTRVGEDAYSDRMIGFLSGNGIETEWIGRDPERIPGLYLIETVDGERSFTYWRDRSAARRLADDESFLRDAISLARAVFFSGITLAILPPDRRDMLIAILGDARRAGKRVAFDPNLRPRLWESAAAMRETVTEAAAVAEFVLPSFDDEMTHFGDPSLEACIARYRAAGAGEIVLKNGGGDLAVSGPDGESRISGLERVRPIDTTGAGDSFNGAYLAARFAGDTMESAARRAHALASRVVRHPGALMPPD